MNVYKTSEVAAMIGIHPNTVRLYEEWGFISKPKRMENGYRIFTDLHIYQMKLARTAFQIEILQHGLRKKIIKMLKASANGEFQKAILLTKEYLYQVGQERDNAEEAIQIVNHILSGAEDDSIIPLQRKEVSEYLGISTDTLRNWEMNGLLTIKRKANGYRIYTEQDIKKLKIIRSLRCANYSLEAILRLLQCLSQNPNADMKLVLNTPNPTDDIISVCDRLIVSLSEAEKNTYQLLHMLQEMRVLFS